MFLFFYLITSVCVVIYVIAIKINYLIYALFCQMCACFCDNTI
jgi:hypothetical protein